MNKWIPYCHSINPPTKKDLLIYCISNQSDHEGESYIEYMDIDRWCNGQWMSNDDNLVKFWMDVAPPEEALP